jgi:hypothetical protein
MLIENVMKVSDVVGLIRLIDNEERKMAFK